jgi:hypothetical protein
MDVNNQLQAPAILLSDSEFLDPIRQVSELIWALGRRPISLGLVRSTALLPLIEQKSTAQHGHYINRAILTL